MNFGTISLHSEEPQPAAENDGMQEDTIISPVEEASRAASLVKEQGLVTTISNIHLEYVTKGSPLGDTLSLSCEASVGASGSNN